jgi:hypothetical protein
MWCLNRLGDVLKKLGAFPIALSLVLILTAAWPIAVRAYPYDPLPPQPGFEGGKVLSGAAINYASPTLADLDNNGGPLEIIIGGRDGMVYALNANGSLRWQFDASAAISAVAPLPAISMIDSAPAVGDLDGDGWPEVVVSVGASPSQMNVNGGIVVLRRNGTLMPGWPQLSVDILPADGAGTPSDGYTDGFWSSPALGDLDGDGDLEIVVGSWDQHVYVWHHDGQLADGWPKFMGDTIWSSPALADLDKDGQLEMVIGTDGHFDVHCSGGGCLHVYRGDGSEMTGFPKAIDQTFYSSPAIADLDRDGWLDIVVGTGNYYAGKGYAIHAWDHTGHPLDGWPVATGGYVLSVPSVGDIDGDGRPEVVVGCNDGKVYAFNGNGSPVPGWPVTMQDNIGNTGPLYFSSPVLANFDADPLPEVFINYYCDTVVLDGNGSYLTHVGNAGASGKPNMYMFNAWCLSNTPAVGDIDLDGRLEIIRGGGDDQSGGGGNALIYVWESDRAPATASWPMFRLDSLHHARYEATCTSNARIVSHTLPNLMFPGESRQAQITIENTGCDTWTENNGYRLGANGSFASGARVSLNPGESIAPGQQKTFVVTLQAPATPGYYTTSWRMVHEGVEWFGLKAQSRVKVGNEPAFYVLSKQSGGTGGGGVYAGGMAPGLVPPAVYSNWPAARTFDFLADHRGYQLLDKNGGVWQGGTAQAIGGHGFVSSAQEILLSRTGTTYYILDKYGQLTRSYGAYSFSPAPPTFSDPRVRSAALTPDGRGIYVLDGYGNVYTGGSAPAMAGTPKWSTDIAKRIKLTADGTGYYVLDAYGRVWNGGAAPSIAPNYTPHGDDWARDFELTADGKGYYLLDREGGIHMGGTAVEPTINLPPVWPGQDVALDLAVADSRALDALVATPGSLTVLTTPGQTHHMTVHLGESSATSFSWSASKDRSWLSVNPGSGSTPSSLTISVNSAGLGLGSYQGSVTISSPGAANSPVSIPVQVLVVRTVHSTYLPLASR